MPQPIQPGVDSGNDTNEEQTPKTLTEADVGNMVNRAVTAQISRFIEKTLPGIFEAQLKPLTEKFATSQQAPKSDGEGEGEGGTKKKSKQDPETLAALKAVEDLKKELEARDAKAAAAEKKLRDERAYNELRAALSEKVRPELLDVAAKMLFHIDQKVTYGEDGTPLFKSKRYAYEGDAGEDVELPIKAGVDEFLKSDAAKAFLPAPSAGNGGGALPKRGPTPVANPNAQTGTGSDADRVQRAMQRAAALSKQTGIPNI